MQLMSTQYMLYNCDIQWSTDVRLQKGVLFQDIYLWSREKGFCKSSAEYELVLWWFHNVGKGQERKHPRSHLNGLLERVIWVTRCCLDEDTIRNSYCCTFRVFRENVECKPRKMERARKKGGNRIYLHHRRKRKIGDQRENKNLLV